MPMTRVDGSVFLFLIRYQQRISVDIFLYIISQCHKKNTGTQPLPQEENKVKKKKSKYD